MEKFSRQRLENIQDIFAEQTGVNIGEKHHGVRWNMRSAAVILSMMLGFLVLSAFAYSKFSSIAGDEVGFGTVYKGNGVFEITITNFSDKELRLQDRVKVMRWSSGDEVPGNTEKILFENKKVAAHSQETIRIDLSGGYNIAELEEPLPAGDWYYLVLTNNYFAFGQDWMCSIDFDEETVNTVAYSVGANEKPEEVVFAAELRFREWIWPTVSKKVSAPYGEQRNGVVSEHINIAGNVGDAVYAVADGIVAEADFDVAYGNYILLELENEITVKYGHLKELLVNEGDTVEQGQKIAELGKSGMATGANLSFAVYRNEDAINPVTE